MATHKLDIRFSASARRDFVAILRYTLATWGEVQMLRYREKLETGLDRLIVRVLHSRMDPATQVAE